MYLSHKIDSLLTNSEDFFCSSQKPSEIAGNLSWLLREFRVNVSILPDKKLKKSEFMISGEYWYDRIYKPIHLYLYFNPLVKKFTWIPGTFTHFKFLASQVLQHELIHFMQNQFPGHTHGYPISSEKEYFSQLDEIDCYGHDIALEIRHHYPTKDAYDILRNISKRRKVSSYKCYEEAFSGTSWNKIKNRLLKKVYLWLPYT